MSDDRSIVQPTDDLPHPPVDEHLWSESYLWTAYDPTARIGMYMHQGTTAFDSNLWRSTLGIALPDRTLMMIKVYGRPDGSTTTGSSSLGARCDDATRRWTVVIDAAGRRVPAAEAQRALVSDGLPTRMVGSLTFDALAPLLHPGPVSWGRLHHEQPCSVIGTLRVEDESIAFDGVGYRDHSMGQRDLSAYRGSDWCYGVFPSGRFFNLVDINFEGAPERHRVGVAWDGASYRELVIAEMADLRALAARPDAISLSVLDAGATERITGKVEGSIYFTHKLPHELCLGVDRTTGAATDLAVVDCLTRYQWDGEEGFGICEWILPVSELGDDDVFCSSSAS